MPVTVANQTQHCQSPQDSRQVKGHNKPACSLSGVKTVGIACCVNPNKLPYPFLYLHTCLLLRSLASFSPIYPRLFLHSYFSLLLSFTILPKRCGSEPYQSLVINLLSDELVFTEWVAGFSGDRVDGAFFHLLLYGTEKREEGLPGTLLHKEIKRHCHFLKFHTNHLQRMWAVILLFSNSNRHFERSFTVVALVCQFYLTQQFQSYGFQ